MTKATSQYAANTYGEVREPTERRLTDQRANAPTKTSVSERVCAVRANKTSVSERVGACRSVSERVEACPRQLWSGACFGERAAMVAVMVVQGVEHGPECRCSPRVMHEQSDERSSRDCPSKNEMTRIVFLVLLFVSKALRGGMRRTMR